MLATFSMQSSLLEGSFCIQFIVHDSNISGNLEFSDFRLIPCILEYYIYRLLSLLPWMEFYNPGLRNTEISHSTIQLVTKCDRFIEKVSSEIKILLVDVLDSRRKAKADVIYLITWLQTIEFERNDIAKQFCSQIKSFI